MSLIVRKEVEDCILGIWEITEDYDTLISKLHLSDEELETLNSFKNYNRKLEWLSVRALICELTGEESKIIYNEMRKPFLKGNSYNISISHSNCLTSILISRTKKVGLDLEYMSHKISSLSFKFINKNESVTDDPELRRYHLYLHWCAKEALYKICDKQDINFKENLTIDPFIPGEKGLINGKVQNSKGLEDFNMMYEKMNDYAIVWTCK
jgi:4'-phosphopantetheinyl transferase